jgi:CRP/FNR family transcriptional regulator, cyclic AMP receptor protein
VNHRARPAKLMPLRPDGGGARVECALSHFPSEDLEAQVESADSAVLVAAPDDRVSSRGKDADAPRDNVVFELGLFMGALTRRRAFSAMPYGNDLKIPTDILGMTPLRYDSAASNPGEPIAAELREVIAKLGP